MRDDLRLVGEMNEDSTAPEVLLLGRSEIEELLSMGEVGKRVSDRLNSEFKSLPFVGHVGGLGLMIGIEIVADKATRKPFDPAVNITGKIQEQAFKGGLSIRGIPAALAAGDSCWFCPPLVITVEEVDKALDILYPILVNLS